MIKIMLIFLLTTWVQGQDLPGWFNKAGRLKEIHKKAVAEGMDRKQQFLMQQYQINTEPMGPYQLTIVRTHLVAEGKGNAKTWSYNWFEVLWNTSKKPKVFLKVINEDTCDAEKLKEIAVEELGSVEEKIDVYALRLFMESSSCPDAPVAQPERVVLVMERKNKLEKIYASPFFPEGHQGISLQNKQLRIDQKSPDAHPILLDWNAKKKKFILKK